MKLKKFLTYVYIIAAIAVLALVVANASESKKEKLVITTDQGIMLDFWTLFSFGESDESDNPEPLVQQLYNQDLEDAKDRLRQIKCRITKKCKK